MKNILFILIDIIQAFRPKNWTVLSVEKYNDYEIIDYFYGGKTYKYIGSKLPTDIRKGFFLPIKSAKWNGTDVTEYVKSFAGPRQDFYGTDPRLDVMFYNIKRCEWTPKYSIKLFSFTITWYKKTIVEPIQGVLEITNVIHQTVVFGAK
jgi:hypothetical protein